MKFSLIKSIIILIEKSFFYPQVESDHDHDFVNDQVEASDDTEMTFQEDIDSEGDPSDFEGSYFPSDSVSKHFF